MWWSLCHSRPPPCCSAGVFAPASSRNCAWPPWSSPSGPLGWFSPPACFHRWRPSFCCSGWPLCPLLPRACYLNNKGQSSVHTEVGVENVFFHLTSLGRASAPCTKSECLAAADPGSSPVWVIYCMSSPLSPPFPVCLYLCIKAPKKAPKINLNKALFSL